MELPWNKTGTDVFNCECLIMLAFTRNVDWETLELHFARNKKQNKNKQVADRKVMLKQQLTFEWSHFSISSAECDS